jgi:hypothetical protein
MRLPVLQFEVAISGTVDFRAVDFSATRLRKKAL